MNFLTYICQARGTMLVFLRRIPETPLWSAQRRTAPFHFLPQWQGSEDPLHPVPGSFSLDPSGAVLTVGALRSLRSRTVGSELESRKKVALQGRRGRHAGGRCQVPSEVARPPLCLF